MTVEYNGSRSAYLTVALTTAAPGIFTTQPLGKGAPLVVNADGTLNSASNPAKKGTWVTFFVSGEGIPQTLGVDGRLAVAPLQTPYLPVTLTVNGSAATPLFAGAAPGSAGLMQVNAPLAATLPAGTLAVALSVGSTPAPPVSVFVQQPENGISVAAAPGATPGSSPRCSGTSDWSDYSASCSASTTPIESPSRARP